MLLTIDPTVAKAKDADAETDGADPTEARPLLNFFADFWVEVPIPDMLEPLLFPEDFLVGASVDVLGS